MTMPIAAAVKVGAMAMAGIVIPWLAWPWIQSMLGSCEGFGCAGGLAFALPVSLVGGIVAALAAVLAYLWTVRARGAGYANPAVLRILVASLVLAPVLRSVPRWPLPDYGLPVAWFFTCALAYAIALRVFRPGR